MIMDPERPASADVETPLKQALIRWEEFALSLEEYFHARELRAKNPNGKPLGH